METKTAVSGDKVQKMANLDFFRLRERFWNGNGKLLPVIVQDADSLVLLFHGFANEESLAYTLEHGIAAFDYVLSGRYRIPGEFDGNTLEIAEIRVSNSKDSLLFLVRPCQGTYRFYGPYDQKERTTKFCFRLSADGQELEAID
jgi:phosphoribosyl-AMP cyclohydrolase